MSIILLNVLYLLIGVAIFGFSIYCSISKTVQEAAKRSENSDRVKNLLYGLMVMGSLTVVVAIFGCCGAYYESACLLGTYFTCLLILFAAELTVGVLCWMFRDTIEDRVSVSLEKLMRISNYTGIDDSKDHPVKFLHLIQRTIQCCGLNGVGDYPSVEVPRSCCIPGHDSCPSKSAAFSVGCNQVAQRKFRMAIALTMSVPLIKVFGLVLAIALCCLVQRQQVVSHPVYTAVEVVA